MLRGKSKKAEKRERILAIHKARTEKMKQQQRKTKAPEIKKNKKNKKKPKKDTIAPIMPTPYGTNDRILLIGEGDFSFAKSLVSYHRCKYVLATCFDHREDLMEKYPQASNHLSFLDKHGARVLYDIDATKLTHKAIAKPPGWDIISFNFPHIGGKSTDVNRQVRANQSLLVSFFRASLSLLARDAGVVLVTLFEGEPYTLWNIRDLARHSGYRVERSWKFDANLFPGYKHARTLGNIEGGGGWKGEQRAARTYAFVPVDAPESAIIGRMGPAGKTEERDDSDSEDEDEGGVKL
ncbi:hypothetical protein NA57DRAFT_68924 [Rhizodiscina lignyota]|uniref:25S rRNA (uridine-N(3))-methyltransferase BMT5-like domain-containing protein n=1 Tax=Rhizodiscina lignyota TaxID=1504668 RepID=A0A9P4I8V7_9PEZI|nr:hypothetical protein NA57DRAFT_68924 [Rhizodiscina lignyota]